MVSRELHCKGNYFSVVYLILSIEGYIQLLSKIAIFVIFFLHTLYLFECL